MPNRSLKLFPAVLAVLAFSFAPMAHADSAPNQWISFQSGRFTGNSATTGGRDLTQSQVGLWLNMPGSEQLWDVNYEFGVLKMPAGMLFDSEFDATGSIQSGNVTLHPLLVVGIPVGLTKDPYNFTGWDVTLGGGMKADIPVGRGFVDVRGQAAFNFLSYMLKLSNEPYDSNGVQHAHDAMLFYRLIAGTWIPMGHQNVRVELRRDDFKVWHTNALGVGIAF